MHDVLNAGLTIASVAVMAVVAAGWSPRVVRSACVRTVVVVVVVVGLIFVRVWHPRIVRTCVSLRIIIFVVVVGCGVVTVVLVPWLVCLVVMVI